MSEPTPPPTSTPPAIRNEGLPPNVAAGLACLFSLVSGVVFLVIERRDKFVRFWAMQSVVLGVVAIVSALLVAIAGPVLGWLPLIGKLLLLVLQLAYWVFRLAWVVVFLVCLIKAFTGQEWEIPLIGKFARRQLARLDAGQEPPERLSPE